jgi:hypothetical protein
LSILNVAIYPPSAVRRKIADLAGDLLPSDSTFRVDDVQRIVHMTLYMARLPKSVLSIMYRFAETFRPKLSKMRCEAVGIARTEQDYVEIIYLKTAFLLELQAAIVDRLAPAAESASSSAPLKVNSAELNSLNAYKYEFVGDAFRPHVTLGKGLVGRPILIPDINLPSLSFTPEALLVGQADKFGAVRSILGSFA